MIDETESFYFDLHKMLGGVYKVRQLDCNQDRRSSYLNFGMVARLFAHDGGRFRIEIATGRGKKMRTHLAAVGLNVVEDDLGNAVAIFKVEMLGQVLAIMRAERIVPANEQERDYANRVRTEAKTLAAIAAEWKKLAPPDPIPEVVEPGSRDCVICRQPLYSSNPAITSHLSCNVRKLSEQVGDEGRESFQKRKAAEKAEAAARKAAKEAKKRAA